MATVYDLLRTAAPADVDGPHGLPVPVRSGILPPAPPAATPPASSMRKLCEHAADALGLLVDDRRHVAGTVLGVGKLGPVAADLLRRRRAEAHDALAALALATVDTDPALAAAASERAGAVAGWRDTVADDEAWRTIYAAMGAERPTDPGMPWVCVAGAVETDPTYRDDEEALDAATLADEQIDEGDDDAPDPDKREALAEAREEQP